MRNNYRIIGNTSDTRSRPTGRASRFNNVHGLEVRDNVQPTQAVAPRTSASRMWHSTHVAITGNRWANAAGVWIDRGGNVDVRSRATSIGTPLAVTPGDGHGRTDARRVAGVPG